MAEKCLTCNSPVRVVSDREGTSHYKPVGVPKCGECTHCAIDVDNAKLGLYWQPMGLKRDTPLLVWREKDFCCWHEAFDVDSSQQPREEATQCQNNSPLSR